MRRCKFDMENSTEGVCTDYFSLLDGTVFHIRSEYDTFLCQSMAAENESIFIIF